MATLNEIQAILEQILFDLPFLIQRSQISPKQVVIVNGLSDLSERLGLVQAGEFRAGNGLEPGLGFSGIRIGYPAFAYNGDTWHIVGVNNDTLQVGISAANGKLYASAGGVIIDSSGVSIGQGIDGSAHIRFEDNSGTFGTIGVGSDGDDLYIFNNVVSDGRIIFQLKFADGSFSTISYREDTLQAGRAQLNIAPTDMGAKFSMQDEIRIEAKGPSGGSNRFRLRGVNNTPENPSDANDEVNIYQKGNLFVLMFNDGGTIRFKSLDLTGTGVTWVHSTTPP